MFDLLSTHACLACGIDTVGVHGAWWVRSKVVSEVDSIYEQFSLPWLDPDMRLRRVLVTAENADIHPRRPSGSIALNAINVLIGTTGLDSVHVEVTAILADIIL